MCEYCTNRRINKSILDIDEDKFTYARVFKMTDGRNLLQVQLDAKDEDGYTANDFFEINYCPMCGRKLEE